MSEEKVSKPLSKEELLIEIETIMRNANLDLAARHQTWNNLREIQRDGAEKAKQVNIERVKREELKLEETKQKHGQDSKEYNIHLDYYKRVRRMYGMEEQ